jgi:membrane-associated phospholipid phosphatase
MSSEWHWTEARRSLARPYRVPPSMIALMALVPLYLVIAGRAREVPPARPHVGLDELFAVQPAWSLVYGALYLFLILLPVIIIQEERLLRATFRAYLVLWLLSYAVFWTYPTVAPRPPSVEGDGFAAWGLRFLYSADPPHNCFPSLHVAHTFVSALATGRVHRRLGWVALACAALVGLSTLFTKQHYVLDVVAGVALSLTIGLLFLRRFRVDDTDEGHRRVAPALAVVTACIVALCSSVFVALYLLGFELTGGPAF